jgi:ubiquinone/menaquinone biosynthesis C-methylase UbiE
LDIVPESFDYVVGTHVLCSVTDIYQVLKQVKRALKPGGKYVFVEHVVAQKEKEPWLYYTQLMMQPVINIIGNGCLFKDTWNYLSPQTGLPGFEIVQLEHRALNMPIPALNPHIFGVAKKVVGSS